MFSFPFSLPRRPPLRRVIYGWLAFTAVLLLVQVLRNLHYLSKDRFQDALEPEVHVSSAEWESRAERVKEAFKHAYHGYEKYAMPKDELRPITNEGMNSYNGWGVTAFDSLDTMLLMGLESEFQRAMEVVKAANFSVTRENRGFVPFFETIIRYLGGLLSAYALSKDKSLLRRAEELADALDPVFNTHSGLAAFGYDPVRGLLHKPFTGNLAEFASFQVEYTYLAKATGRRKFYDRVRILHERLLGANLTDTGGMLPTMWDLKTGLPQADQWHVSVGSRADSTHEYLLKQYLLTGRADKKNLEAYLRTTSYILTNLLYLSPKRGLLYATDAANPSSDNPTGKPSHTHEHLSCFLPGLLALGMHTLPLNDLQSIGIDFTALGGQNRVGWVQRR
ncbi:hypothetical protein NMY22_g18861 [Coprinellus aureogranulatus]|nr:hypothetical protein NMY22_g18861 [Coprinellus aureogranulatus]